MVLAFVFPMRCPGCGALAEPVCDRCARELRPPDTVPAPAGVDSWVAAFAYEGTAADLIAGVKYRSVRAVVPWLADAMVAARADACEPDVVTWAPTTRARIRRRGIDHAALLARAVARRLRCPVRPLLRRDPGPAQTGAPRAARSAIRFTARRAPERVLVVDDVATTGATLAAAARALRAVGATEVEALTAGRTPERGSTTFAGRGVRMGPPRSVGN